MNTPLDAAGTTALGHTLLHISTLPLTDGRINILSQKIFQSIHDVRTLDNKGWGPINFRWYNPARRSISTCYKSSFPLARTAEDEEDSRRQDVGAQDVYSNTPLHYFASAMYANNELGKVRAFERGETVWKSSRNELGYTPEDLLEDWKAFWVDADSPVHDIYPGS